MEEVLNVYVLINDLLRNNTSPEELINKAMQNLYAIESEFMYPNKVESRNSIRATTAYLKMLYDFGQRMYLARVYLLHKIKLLEVKENDLNFEISVLRGLSSSPGEACSQLGDSNHSTDAKNRPQFEDTEIEIILDTRIIDEIDQSKLALHNISEQIASKKKALSDIDRQMDDVSSFLTSSREMQDTSILETEHNNINCSRIEQIQELGSLNCSRVGNTRKLSPNLMLNMDMSQEMEKTLLSQEEIGTSRGRQSGEPDAAGSIATGRELYEDTTGMDSSSVSVAQVVTGEFSNIVTEEVTFNESQIIQYEELTP